MARRVKDGEQVYLQAYVRYGDAGKIPADITYRVFQFDGGVGTLTDELVFSFKGTATRGTIQ